MNGLNIFNVNINFRSNVLRWRASSLRRVRVGVTEFYGLALPSCLDDNKDISIVSKLTPKVLLHLSAVVGTGDCASDRPATKILADAGAKKVISI